MNRELNRLIQYAQWHTYKFGYAPEDIVEQIKELAQDDVDKSIVKYELNECDNCHTLGAPILWSSRGRVGRSCYPCDRLREKALCQ